jgi:ABC-type amino acid transport substrate-binding protein
MLEENPNDNLVNTAHNSPFQMFPWFITLFPLLASQLLVINAEELTVALWKGSVLPYADINNEDPSKWRGIHVDLLNNICPMLGGCTFLPVDTLDERLSVLEPGGPANFSIGISVTPERQDIVDFIKPYYYSTGATLYSTPEASGEIIANGGWDGLHLKPICILQGYYFQSTLVSQFSALPVIVETSVEGTDTVIRGECLAFIHGSGYALGGGLLPVPTLPSQAVSPLGIAVSKAASPELRASLAAAMIRLMQNGPESTMIQLEHQYATVLPVNVDLANTVDAISTFDTGVLVVSPLNTTLAALVPPRVKATPALSGLGILPLASIPPNAKELAESTNFTWPVSWDGFEVAVVNRLCTTTLDCTPPIILSDLDAPDDSRFTAVEGGGSGNPFTISSVAVNPLRAEQAQFVKPYYYESGAVIYATPDNAQAIADAGGWEGIRDQPICATLYFFAGQLIENRYSPQLIYVRTVFEGINHAAAGMQCIGFLYDSNSFLGNLVPVPGLKPEYISPFGIIMTKGGDPNLYAALSAGLVDMMDDGDDSEMLKYEEAWFGDFPRSEKLRRMVNALSNFSIGGSSVDGSTVASTSGEGGDVLVSGGGKGSAGCIVLLLCSMISIFFLYV